MAPESGPEIEQELGAPEGGKPSRLSRHAVVTVVGVVLMLLGFGVLGFGLNRDTRKRTQRQEDPNVMSVWVIGVTAGRRHALVRGSAFQRLLNSCGVHRFGDADTLQSHYSGDPDALEIWFDYDSLLPGRPNLECHRVAETAFIDDLGQRYHGYLDFHGRIVGIYLPGYDHSARRIACAVRWMPRAPARPLPRSTATTFTIDLPRFRRVLRRGDTLPPGPVTVAHGSITVTVSGARLGVPKLEPFKISQRDLTFRLKIEGGELANRNISPIWNSFQRFHVLPRRDPFAPLLFAGPPGQPPVRALTPVVERLEITDPYGVSLLSDTQMISPLMSPDGAASLIHQDGTVWTAPINGAGRGTDAACLHLDVRPSLPANAPLSTPPPPAVHFDIVFPVQSDTEA